MDLKLKGSNTEKVREKNASGRRQNLIAKRTTHNTEEAAFPPAKDRRRAHREKKRIFSSYTAAAPQTLRLN